MKSFLILLLIHYIGYFMTTKSSVFTCGLFGWVGKNPAKFSLSKFNILGVMNEVRGEHSCGLSVDGQIEVGVDNEKLYRDFILLHNSIKPTKIPIVLGHTRQASIGMAKTIDNAHPFGFGQNKDKYNLIGVHNGTIFNYNELASTFKVSLTEKLIKEDKAVEYRVKIDSEILLEAIYKNKNYKILEQYNGCAALLWYDTREPNLLYVFRGASKKSPNIADERSYYERPLYYYQETRNSLYISSIEESLIMIGAEAEKTLGEFEANIIYKIKDGNLSKAEKIFIDRSASYKERVYFYPTASNIPYQRNIASRYDQSAYEDYPGWDDESSPQNSFVDQYERSIKNKKNRVRIKKESKSKKKNRNIFNNKITNEDPINIYEEATYRPQAAYGPYPFFKRFRFYRTGHLITGIYIYIKKFGYYFLAEEEKSAISSFNFIIGMEYINDTFIKSTNKNTSYIPFSLANVEELNRKHPFHFFFEGIKLKDFADYKLLVRSKTNKKSFSIEQLSLTSAHPIISMGRKYGINNQNILYNSKIYDGKFAILGGERIYEVEDGNLKNITNLPTIEACENQANIWSPNLSIVSANTNSKVKKIIHILPTTNEEIQKKEKSSNKIILDALLNKTFLNLFSVSSNVQKELKKYQEFPEAVAAIEFLEVFDDTVPSLIINDYKKT